MSFSGCSDINQKAASWLGEISQVIDQLIKKIQIKNRFWFWLTLRGRSLEGRANLSRAPCISWRWGCSCAPSPALTQPCDSGPACHAHSSTAPPAASGPCPPPAARSHLQSGAWAACVHCLSLNNQKEVKIRPMRTWYQPDVNVAPTKELPPRVLS